MWNDKLQKCMQNWDYWDTLFLMMRGLLATSRIALLSGRASIQRMQMTLVLYLKGCFLVLIYGWC